MKKINTLVLGTSSGIGLAITKKLLECNHKIIGLSKNKPNIKNDNFNYFKINLSNKNQFSNFLKKYDINTIDNFIINSGINDIADLSDISIDRLISLYKINLFPAFELLQRVSEISKSNKKPKSIVFITSIWTNFGIKGRAMYGSSKGALVSLAKHASAELSQESIFVNCVSPGFTKTEMTKINFDEKIQKALERTAKNELQETNTISSAIKFLLIPHNKGITGQEIFIDSGFSAHA